MQLDWLLLIELADLNLHLPDGDDTVVQSSSGDGVSADLDDAERDDSDSAEDTGVTVNIFEIV